MKKALVACAFIFAAAFILVSCQTNGTETGDLDPLAGIDLGALDDNLIPYPWPDGMTKYKGVTMAAGGKRIDLYSVRANPTHRWSTATEVACIQMPVAMFDMEDGPIDVVIAVSAVYKATGTSTVAVGELKDVIIRPLSSNISHEIIGGNKIKFSLPKEGQYSVEWNNQPEAPRNALLIFASKAETFADDEDTVTLGPGIHPDDFDVAEYKTLILQPGAVVRGRIRMNSNSKLLGRGIIDGSHLGDHIQNNPVVLPIETFGKNNIEIRGITIFDPNAWTVQLQTTSNVTIDNLKIVSSRCNSDGISIQSSDNITITNSFFRTWDDGVVLKNYQDRNTSDITVTDCIFWTDLAQSMEIGVETNKKGALNLNPAIYNVTFENITVFHALHKAPLSIHNGDNANIYSIVFKDIVIENYYTGQGDGWNYLIDITNLTGSGMGGAASWTTVQERGTISDVTIDGVTILGGRPHTMVSGRFDSSQGGSISGVTIKDVYYGEGEGRIKLSAPPDGFGTIRDNTSITWQ